MLNRPTNRRRSQVESLNINLVPMLDALVTLIAFLLLSMSFVSIVGMDSPLPITSGEEKPPLEKKLQLTVSILPDKIRVWSSSQKIESTEFVNSAEGEADLSSLHQRLLEIKKQFPEENQAVLVPYDQMNYQELVSVMDSIRLIQDDDEFETEDGKLFSEIVFGNILSKDE